MTVKSILSFKKVPIFSFIFMIGSFLWGASNDYVALFSSEEDDFRRIVLDGAADRRVEVELDELGQAEIKVWGVSEQLYVGRRIYKSGYLIPVTIQVNFPTSSYMSIGVTGTRFKDYIRFQVVESEIYIIDLFTDVLPKESYFREETISAFWPSGRFEPDITPLAEPVVLAEVEGPVSPMIAAVQSRTIIPYRTIILRAVILAGCVSGFLLIIGLVMWFLQQRKSISNKSDTSQPISAVSANQPAISDARVRAFMALDNSLSYDEATLLKSIGGSKSSKRVRALS